MNGRVFLSIRPAMNSEFEALGKLLERSYRASGPLEDEYALILASAPMNAGPGDVLVAERVGPTPDTAGETVGTVTLCPLGTHHSEIAGPDELEFRFLAVEPAYWGSGVASELVRAVVERSREIGIGRLVCCVIEWNEPAHRLYLSHGFSRAPHRDWSPRDGVTLLAYELKLD